MREALLTIVLAAIALAGFLFVSQSRSKRQEMEAEPDVVAIGENPTPRSIEEQMLDLTGATGDSVFTPQRREVILNGTPHTYAQSLFWCGRFKSPRSDSYEFRDVRLLFNKQPKTEADLPGLATVDPTLDSNAIGNHLLSMMGNGFSGLRAGQARFIGGQDIQTAKEIDLREEVHLWLVDPKDPTRVTEVITPSLRVFLREGDAEQSRATTEDDVQIVINGGYLRGRGLTVDMHTGLFRMEQNISGSLEDVALVGRTGVPLHLEAQGPMVYELQPAKPGEDLAQRGGILTILKDVVLEQGLERAAGQKLTMKRTAGDGRIHSLLLEEDVDVRTAQGTFAGDLVRWEANQKGKARLTLKGAPIVAHLKGGARMIPGSKAGGDLELRTSGTVVFHDLDAPDDQVREITASPGLTLRTSDSELHAGSGRMFLHEVASQSATAGPNDRVSFPAKVILGGGVSGQTPSGALSGDQLTYERTFLPDGSPKEDTVLLEVNPVFTWYGEKATIVEGTPEPSRSRKLLEGVGSLTVTATDSLLLVMDPLRVASLRAEARGQVVAKSFADREGSVLKSRISGDEIDLLVTEEWTQEVDETGVTQRFVSKRTVESAQARGDVALSDSDRLRADGDLVTYLRGAGELHVTREEGKARVAMTDREGRENIVNAPVIVWREGTREFTARDGADAVVWVERLGYGKGLDPTPVRTRIQGETFQVWLTDSDPKNPDSTSGIREILATSGLILDQDVGTHVDCTFFRADLKREEMLIRGTPATLVVLQKVQNAERPETFIAPSITLMGAQVLVTGPLDVTFHARNRDLALSMHSSQRNNGAVKPINLKAQGSMAITMETILIQGPATVRQGNPDLEGFELEGDRITLFLESLQANTPEDSLGKRLASLAIAKASAEGRARFRSRDLTGDGDVMEFDIHRKVITLFRYQGQGNATLSWRGRWQAPFPRFDLDLSNADNPIVSTSRSVPTRVPR